MMNELNTTFFCMGSLDGHGWVGCTTHHLVIGEHSCSLKEWQADDYFTQDVLPGMESNLRKQRIYVVVGAEAMGFDEQGEWLLAVIRC